MKTEKTITGDVDPDVLDYTVGDDPVLDMDLVTWDCLGTAAPVTMLSEMPVTPPVVTKDEAAREAFRELWDAFNLYEMDMEANYDHSLCIATLNQIFKTDSHLPQEDEPVLNLDLH